MRSILTLCVLLLLVVGVENRAWGKMDVGEKAHHGDFLAESRDALRVECLWEADGTRGGAPWGWESALDVRDGPNLYAYVRQNPWTKFDPEGLVAWSINPNPPEVQAGRAIGEYVSKNPAQAGSLATDFVPGIGTAKGAVEVITGRDPVTGNELSVGERVVAGIGTLASVLPGGKAAIKGLGKVLGKADEAATSATKAVTESAQAVSKESAEAVVEAAKTTAVEARGGTYLLRDPVTDQVVRTGRSNDLLRRAGEHGRDPVLRDFQFEPVHRIDVYSQQRGLEQLLHDMHNPPLNKVRPISPTNPKRPTYLDAAQQFSQGGNP